MPFGIGHPPHLHIKLVYVCRRVQGSQIFKQNWIILICSRVIVILPIWVFLALGVGQVGGGCLEWSAIVFMSSGMFRGKESSNRIELSQLVQDLLNLVFWAPCGSGGGGWMDGGGGGWGGAPYIHVHACTCIHLHACMHAHVKHDNFMQMAAPIGGIPGTSLWCHTCMCVCVHVCMHVHVHVYGGTLSPPPHHHPPTPTPQGGPPESLKIQ